MSLTIGEIAEYQERFRQEIVQRECVIAALEVLRTHAANGRAPRSIDLGSLVAALVPTIPPSVPAESAALPPPAPVMLPSPAPAALPAKPDEKPYMHPELRALDRGYGSNGVKVAWAVRRMTGDYTIRDIAELLEREGLRMQSAELSVVLTRFKNRGEIEEIKRGSGRNPAVFRGPARAAIEETAPAR